MQQMDASFKRHSMGTVQKKKPLPKIPQNRLSSLTTDTDSFRQQHMLFNNNVMDHTNGSWWAHQSPYNQIMTESPTNYPSNHDNGYYEQDAMDGDPYYSHQYGQGYTMQPQSYYQPNYDITPGWKTTSGHLQSKNMMVRSDSLKIESSTSLLLTEVRLEKPFEPTATDDQQPSLFKKVSKQELYTFDAPTSLLLSKLNESVQQRQSMQGLPSSYDSGTETPTSTSSGEDATYQTPSVSSYDPLEPPRLLGDQKQHRSMPILSQEEQNMSFSASERYFEQPNPSPVSSRIPSPWGTRRSKTMVRQSISRISTGSIPNMMTVQTVQIPDEVVLATKSVSEPVVNKAEQYFLEDEQRTKYSLSIASCSLINIRSNTKLYRRMAIKTRNKETQMTYAKYLLQISKLYEKNNHTVMSCPDAKVVPVKKPESPAETRHRLLSEAGYWIEKLAKAGLAEALFIKGKWHLLGPQAEDCVMHGYEKVSEPKAFKCFLASSKAGYTDAHHELAHLWKKRGNYTKAIQCYEKGAREKHTPSIYVSSTLVHVK